MSISSLPSAAEVSLIPQTGDRILVLQMKENVWGFLLIFKRKPTACLPIGVVLTIAAAGSEMSGSCVITKEDGGMKRGCTTDYSRLKFAVLDPELTMTTSTVSDSMSDARIS